MRSRAIVVRGGALIALGLAGCADAPAVSDGGEPTVEVVFGFQRMPPLDRVAPGHTVMLENGAEYLFIDRANRFWVYQFAEAPARMWASPRTGVLDGVLRRDFERDLLSRDWAAFDGELAPPPSGLDHPSTATVWHGDLVAACGQPCDEASPELREVVELAQEWLRRLYAVGADYGPSGPVRLLAFPVEVPLDAVPFTPWSGPSPFSTLAVSAMDAASTYQRFGSHRSIAGDDAIEFRRLRNRYRSGIEDSFSYQFLPILDERSVTHQLFGRDALPIEDDFGLVRPRSSRTLGADGG